MADHLVVPFCSCLFPEIEFHTVAKAGLKLHVNLPAWDFIMLGSQMTHYTRLFSAFLFPLTHLLHYMCKCVIHLYHGTYVESEATFGMCIFAMWVPGTTVRLWGKLLYLLSHLLSLFRCILIVMNCINLLDNLKTLILIWFCFSIWIYSMIFISVFKSVFYCCRKQYTAKNMHFKFEVRKTLLHAFLCVLV